MVLTEFLSAFFISWIWNLALVSSAVAFNTYNACFTSFCFVLIFITTAVSVRTKACIVNEMKYQVFVVKTYVALTKNIQKNMNLPKAFLPDNLHCVTPGLQVLYLMLALASCFPALTPAPVLHWIVGGFFFSVGFGTLHLVPEQ